MKPNTPENQQTHGAHRGRGPTSFWMHSPQKVFDALALAPGETFLDLGCGPGDYSVKAAEMVGPAGLVFALDKGADAIAMTNAKKSQRSLANLRVMRADITGLLPLENQSIDLCLLATVLHIVTVKNAGPFLFREIRRVLKPGGRLTVLECKKEDQPFGPPKHIRLSPEQVAGSLAGHGYQESGLIDLGYNYLLHFTAA